jgi:ParB family chromosome partitioning protein
VPNKLGKPKLKDFDDLFGEVSSGVNELDITSLVPFKGHPFSLGSEEGLSDLATSIQTNGVLVPIIVRNNPNGAGYEILAGHRRTEGSKRAGKTKVPAIILSKISDDDAIAIVVETNLIQRSFSDMSYSEKAYVIALHYSKMFSQGKRNDILRKLQYLESSQNIDQENTLSQVETKLRTDEKVGATYSLSRNTIARYLRINKLNDSLKTILDEGKISFIPAVEVSFLTEVEQGLLVEQLNNGLSLDMKKAKKLREYSTEGKLDKEAMISVLSGKVFETVKKSRKINISNDLYSQYFTEKQSAKEVESIVGKALKMYFKKP